MEGRPPKEYTFKKLGELCRDSLENLPDEASDKKKSIDERPTIRLQQLDRTVRQYTGSKKAVIVDPDTFDELTPLQREKIAIGHYLQTQWGLHGAGVPRAISDYLELAVPES